jgi:hypothetical protein
VLDSQGLRAFKYLGFAWLHCCKYIHNGSRVALDAGLPMSFGWVASREELLNTTTYSVDEPGPNGFMRQAIETRMSFEATIPGKNGHDTTITLPPARGKMPEQLQAILGAVYEMQVGLCCGCSAG